MIEIKADSKDLGNQIEVNVSVQIHAGNKEATKELCAILKCLYDKQPEIFMDALELHMKDIFDEIITVRECFEEGDEDD